MSGMKREEAAKTGGGRGLDEDDTTILNKQGWIQMGELHVAILASLRRGESRTTTAITTAGAPGGTGRVCSFVETI